MKKRYLVALLITPLLYGINLMDLEEDDSNATTQITVESVGYSNATLSIKDTNGSIKDLNLSDLVSPTITSFKLDEDTNISSLILSDGKSIPLDTSYLVQKDGNKTLSTNDLTDDLKQSIESVKVKSLKVVDFDLVATNTDDSESIVSLLDFKNEMISDVTYDEDSQVAKIDLTTGTSLTLDLSSLAKKSKVVTDTVLVDNNLSIIYSDNSTLNYEIVDLDTKLMAAVITDQKKLELTLSDGVIVTGDLGIFATNQDVAKKVDKVEGKVLSSNDFTDDFKDKISAKKVNDISTDIATQKLNVKYTDGSLDTLSLNDIVTDTQVTGVTFDKVTKEIVTQISDGNIFKAELEDIATIQDVNNKVSKVAGKGLSSNDLTDALKYKIRAKKIKDVILVDKKLKILYTDGTDLSLDLNWNAESINFDPLTSTLKITKGDDVELTTVLNFTLSNDIDSDSNSIGATSLAVKMVNDALLAEIGNKKVAVIEINPDGNLKVTYTDDSISIVELEPDSVVSSAIVDGTSLNLLTSSGGKVEVDLSVLIQTKETLGLGNVDNTSDINKPISIAVQEALDGISTEISASVGKTTIMKATAQVTLKQDALTIKQFPPVNIEGCVPLDISIAVPFVSTKYGVYINLNAKVNETWYNLGNSGAVGSLNVSSLSSDHMFVERRNYLLDFKKWLSLPDGDCSVIFELTGSVPTGKTSVNSRTSINSEESGLDSRGSVLPNVKPQNYTSILVREVR